MEVHGYSLRRLPSGSVFLVNARPSQQPGTEKLSRCCQEVMRGLREDGLSMDGSTEVPDLEYLLPVPIYTSSAFEGNYQTP